MEGLTKSVVLWNACGADGIVGNGYAPNPCTDFQAKPKTNTVLLTWKDPDDTIIIDDVVEVRWKSTVIVRKTGSYPTSPSDGTVVITSRIRNQYMETPYTDAGLVNGTTYYYAAFSCSDRGVYGEKVTIDATPNAFKTMTVKIDLSNSNPATCGSYADDAVGMTAGKTSQDWADFFGYKPCLFKDGKVVGYLNPKNYTQFENGTAADITSGNAGDVMVEFPRRGLKISKSGSIVTVSMTDDPDDSSFKYYAHQRGSTQKDYFYVGAYLGYYSSSKLRSLSGKSPTDYTNLSVCRTYAGNLGSGYMNVGFYQFLFLQCMYLLQYKGNLNSQTAHGYGYCDNVVSKSNTGATNAKGMMYGSTSGRDHVKLFGIEDFWGNLFWWLDGYYTNGSYHILTATDGFNNSGSGYTDRGTSGGALNTSGYFNNVTGTSETGFTPTLFNGSRSTYFCDNGVFSSDYVPYVGGKWNDSTDTGVFQFVMGTGPSNNASDVGGRLGYL